MRERSPLEIATIDKDQLEAEEINWPELHRFLEDQHDPFYPSFQDFREDMAEILGQDGLVVWARDKAGGVCSFVSVCPKKGSEGQNFLVINNLTNRDHQLPTLVAILDRAFRPYSSRCQDLVFSIDPDHSLGEKKRFLVYQRLGFREDPRLVNPNDLLRKVLTMPLKLMFTRLDDFQKGGGEKDAWRKRNNYRGIQNK